MDPLARSASRSASVRVRAEWSAGTPPGIAQVLAGSVVVDAVVADAEQRWERGLPATLEVYAAADGRVLENAELCRALLMCEAAQRRDEDLETLRQDFLTRFPQLREEVEDLVALLEVMREAETPRVQLQPGMRLGKYELVDLIGSGGFGQVWQARDTELERYVALKLFELPPAREPGGTRGNSRLIAEARAAAALDHENIVRIHDAGVFPELGLGYLDSQLAGDPDPTPEDPRRVRVARPLTAVAPLPPREAARIIEAAARAVAAAHARLVLHRDIKPGNILLTTRGRPLVADFGLAHDLGGAPEQRVVGTPAYMAPEQARAEPATPQSDVYGLGATLRFLLTGRDPYVAGGRYSPAPHQDVLEQARRAEAPPLRGHPGVPADLGAIVDKATAHRPADRYTSADQLAADLRAFLEARPVMARRASPLHAFSLAVRRHRGAAVVALAAGLALCAATAAYITHIQQERDRARSAEIEALRLGKLADEARDAARAERDEANRQRDTALAVNAYVADTIVAALRNSRTETPTIEEALGLAERRMPYAIPGDPMIEAGVRVVLGSALLANKDYSRAQRHLQRAVQLRAERLGSEAPDTLRARRLLASAMLQSGETEAAWKEFEALALLCERTLGETDIDTGLTYVALGTIVLDSGDEKGAEPLLIKAEASLRNGPGISLLEWQEVGGRLASMYASQGRRRECTQLRRVMAEAAAKALGPDDVRVLNARNNLAKSLWNEGSLDEAEAEYRALLQDSINALGAHHGGAVYAATTLADFMMRARRDPNAAYTITQTAVPPSIRAEAQPILRGPVLLTEARALAAMGRLEEAQQALAQARADGVAAGVAGQKLLRQVEEVARAMATLTFDEQ